MSEQRHDVVHQQSEIITTKPDALSPQGGGTTPPEIKFAAESSHILSTPDDDWEIAVNPNIFTPLFSSAVTLSLRRFTKVQCHMWKGQVVIILLVVTVATYIVGEKKAIQKSHICKQECNLNSWNQFLHLNISIYWFPQNATMALSHVRMPKTFRPIWLLAVITHGPHLYMAPTVAESQTWD